MRTPFIALAVAAVALAACGEMKDAPAPADETPQGKIRVEYYEISKK